MSRLEKDIHVFILCTSTTHFKTSKEYQRPLVMSKKILVFYLVIVDSVRGHSLERLTPLKVKLKECHKGWPTRH